MADFTSINRRVLLKGATLGIPLILLGGTAAYAVTPEKLADGNYVGRVVEYLDGGARLHEVLSPSGNRVGYILDKKTRKELAAISKDLQGLHVDSFSSPWDNSVTPQGNVWSCAGALALFVAETAIPGAKVAKTGWRLVKLVRRYGVQKVARILRGAWHLADRSAQQEFRMLAAELLGIGMIQKECFQ